MSGYILPTLFLAIIAWWGIGYGIMYYVFRRTRASRSEKISSLEIKASSIIHEANIYSSTLIKETQKKLEEKEIQKSRERDHQSKKLDAQLQKLFDKESLIDKKRDELETREKKLKQDHDNLITRTHEIEKKLELIAGMTAEEAKKEIFGRLESSLTKEKSDFVAKFSRIKKEEAEKEARKIIAQALPRVAWDHISEYTITSIDIPNEEFKGKMIGREGRNIQFFEKVTGCELLIDDTPGIVRVSSFDHDKRYLAAETLKSLIIEGKMNPYFLEKKYKELTDWFESMMIEKGKDVLQSLWLGMIHPWLMMMIGKMSLRYSYGQNLLSHSIEVAKISEAIGVELGLDGSLAKKAWLLHDIGKITVQSGESHALVGGEILKQHGMDPLIINAAESHHGEVPMISEISWIVTAADAMSGSRPWARFNSKDILLEKMTEMEKTVMNLPNVQKVHIMQGWREIYVFVNPDTTKDEDLDALLRTVATTIEAKLDYPWIIRVSMMREKKIMTFLK